MLDSEWSIANNGDDLRKHATTVKSSYIREMRLYHEPFISAQLVNENLNKTLHVFSIKRLIDWVHCSALGHVVAAYKIAMGCQDRQSRSWANSIDKR